MAVVEGEFALVEDPRPLNSITSLHVIITNYVTIMRLVL